MTDEFIVQGTIERLCLQPGDVVVVTYPGPITAAKAESLKQWAEQHIPGHEVIVMCDGTRLSVLSPDGPMEGSA